MDNNHNLLKKEINQITQEVELEETQSISNKLDKEEYRRLTVHIKKVTVGTSSLIQLINYKEMLILIELSMQILILSITHLAINKQL